MERKSYRVKDFFEYSKASRCRIRRALREARIPKRRNSSSDEDANNRPLGNVNADGHLEDVKSSSADDSSSHSSVEEPEHQRNHETAESSVSSDENDSVFHADGEDRNSEGDSPDLDDIPSDQAEGSNSSYDSSDRVDNDHREDGGEAPILDDQVQEEVEESDYDSERQDNDHNSGSQDSDDRSADGEASDSGGSIEGEEQVEDNYVQRDQGQNSGGDSEDENGGPDFGEEWNGPNNDNEPVYEYASITVGESMYAILCFFLRHNLPQVCLSDLLSLINLHCRQEGNQFPKTVHNFKNFFQNIQFPLVRRYYCPKCHQPVNNLRNICGHCNHARGFNFFLEISIVSQLRALYRRPGFKDKLNHRFERRIITDGNLEDIYDGNIYKELSENNGVLANPSNISLMWYTDGVSIFKSSKYELWPFYLSINELPYHDRSKLSNALLAGLWFGKEKPAPSTFLHSIREDIMRLRGGIQVQFGDPVHVMTVKGIVIGGTADLPAKAKFLNFKNFNGTYGCSKCKIRSRNIRRGLNVYPYQNNLDLRSTAETLRFAEEAMALPLLNGNRQDVFGVKGPSILSTFVYQYVRSTAVDIMHCAYLNLAKSLLHFWFHVKFRDSDFSLYYKKAQVNERLSKITPPNFIQRLTRTLEYIKYWKAHELKAFLLYYSIPVLHDLMPELYFEHHKLVVGALYLLNQPSVSQAMIAQASDLLHEYVSQFENLYGVDHMTCNLHQLLHLASVTSDFGPLWVTSCFPFENLNGKLKKLVKGTRYAELQVCSGVSMLMKLAELKLNIPPNGSAYIFCENMFDSNRGRKLTHIGHSMAIVGKYVKKNNVPEVIRYSLNRGNIIGGNFYEFYRLKKYSLEYSSEQYGRVVMTKSYCVKYSHDGVEGLGYIDRFLRVTNCDCPNFCVDCDPKYLALIRECQVTEDFSMLEGTNLHFLHTFHDFGELLAVEISNIMSMCFVVNVQDANITFLVEPVNLIEAE